MKTPKRNLSEAERKERNRERYARWRETNRERDLANKKAYRERPEIREKQKKYLAEYHLKNREKALEKRKAYYQANKEKWKGPRVLTPEQKQARKEYAAKYRAEHREELREKNRKYKSANFEKEREYRKQNKESIQARRAVWIVANKARYDKSRSNWAKNNRDKTRAASRAASHKRRVIASTSTEQELQVIKEWEMKWRKSRTASCYWCGAVMEGKLLHLDHIIPLSRGGRHEIGNVCISCPSCNQKKSAKDLAAWNSSLPEPVLL
jgi:5-methylcytosine-specific restriction endonuclease McrA